MQAHNHSSLYSVACIAGDKERREQFSMRRAGTETAPCLRDGFAVLGLAYQLIVCDVPQSSLQKTNDYTGSQEVSREKRCTSMHHHF